MRRATCERCLGLQVIQHPDWAEFFREHPDGHRLYGWQLLEWFSKKGQTALPDEEIDCPDCEGAGVVQSEVSLASALIDLGVIARIERLEGPLVTRPVVTHELPERSYEDEPCNVR